MRKILLATAFCVLLSTPAFATQSFDARSFAMGGIGASTADNLTAPFHNPALTARYKDTEKFSVLLPAFGIGIYDKDDTIDAVDNLVDAIDVFEISPNAVRAADISNRIRDLQGKSVFGQAGLGLAVAIPTDFVAINVFNQNYLDAGVHSDIDSADFTINAGGGHNFQSKAFITGAQVSEFGVSLAKEYALKNGTLYYGLTPKIQRVETINYVVSIDNYDFDDFDSNQYTNSETSFNLDMGLAYAYKNVTLGLVVTNLFSQDYDLNLVDGIDGTYELNPVVTASVSYEIDRFTVGADIDLTAANRFEELRGLNVDNPMDSDDDDMQMAGIGAEFRALSWLDLRTGYQFDMANNLNDQFTAGFGVKIFDTVAIDLSGAYGGSNQLGGSLQLAFTF